MVSFLIIFFTVALVLLSLFLLLVILMQRSGSDMGTAMGGGAVEAAFGVATTNVLTRATSYGMFAFFIIAFGVYLMILSNAKPVMLEDGAALPEFSLTDVPVESVEVPAEMELEQNAEEAQKPTDNALPTPTTETPEPSVAEVP